MNQSPVRNGRATADLVIVGFIVVVAFVVFWFSPIHQVTDSTYSMLLSESLLKHRSFALDHYAISPAEVEAHTQLERVNDHIYYYAPAGGPILSIPLVAVMNAFHLTAVNPDGTFNLRGEVKMQALLAALLMAALAGVFFFTARLLLSRTWSVFIALGAVFGTQIWSTASRALWSHTWEILLLGLVVWMLLAAETGRRKLRPMPLATLLAWSYFARPAAAVPILAVTIYILLIHRRDFARYALAGSFWAAVLAVYSWVHFGHLLPRYYREQISIDNPWFSLTGNLTSPSRGLLVYVPVLAFVIYLLAGFWKEVAYKRLVWLALFVVAAHFITLASLKTWWGGAGYGARLTTDLVPWFLLLSIVGVDAMLKSRARSAQPSRVKWRIPITAGLALLLVSIFINGRGAISRETTNWETWRWEARPAERDNRALWDWRYPQFLAGLIRPPLPDAFPPAEAHIELSNAESSKYLWYGWSGPEPPTRWTDGHEAAIIFSLPEVSDTVLEMKLGPYLDGKLTEQNVNVYLNGQQISSLKLTERESRTVSMSLPRNILRDRNVLRFSLPNASSPEALNTSEDPRLLGVKVEWLEFRPMPVN